jgi:prepilin-type N-terminal cleavage/methylation domain-containing protein
MRLPRKRDDQGYSLTELLISMMVFGILMAITMLVMIQLVQQSSDTIARTESIQQARLGIAQIDRQVRSGNVILNPEFDTTADVPGYFSMRILTDAEEETRCAQWRVIDEDGDEFGDLQFRDWDPDYPTVVDVTDWGVVARDLIQMDVTPTVPSDITDDPTTWPPFWVQEASGDENLAQFVRITLRLKDKKESADAKPTSITTVVTGRNTVFTHPTDSCTQVPPP